MNYRYHDITSKTLFTMVSLETLTPSLCDTTQRKALCSKSKLDERSTRVKRGAGRPSGGHGLNWSSIKVLGTLMQLNCATKAVKNIVNGLEWKNRKKWLNTTKKIGGGNSHGNFLYEIKDANKDPLTTVESQQKIGIFARKKNEICYK